MRSRDSIIPSGPADGHCRRGDVYVVAQATAAAAILAQADQTSTANWYNGDDAIVLAKSGVAIDSIGQIGVDPGTQWGTDPASTADNTIRRLPAVCANDLTDAAGNTAEASTTVRVGP